MLARIKFEIGGLVREIVERLPAEVFTSTETTFLDPAMAGGQFLVEIIRKLRDNGHSDDNIASRVFGLAEDRLDLNYAQRKNGVIGQLAVGGIETLENYKNMGKKFDVIVVNPPYDKHGKEPLYYDFMRLFTKQTGAIISVIIPAGWVSGPKAKTFRDTIFNKMNISRMQYLTNEAFNGDILQPTLLVDAIIGSPTTSFDFVRTVQGQEMTTSVDMTTDVYDHGMPLYLCEMGKELISAASAYSTPFACKTGKTTGFACSLGPANMSGYYLSTLPYKWYVEKIIYAITATHGVDNKDRVFHECATQHDADNLKHWMHSAGARLIMAQWATSYRNTRSNIGRIPAVIVPGVYSHEAAYDMLGLSQDTKDWLATMECYDPNNP